MKTRSHAHSPSALTLGGAPVKTAHEELPAIQHENIQVRRVLPKLFLAAQWLGLHTLTAKAWVQPLIRAPRPHKLHGTANDHRGICLRCCPSGSPWGGHLGARPWYGMKNATGICPNGGSMSHNVQSRTQMLTSTTVRQTATPNLPVREWDHGPPSQLLCKHQRLQHLRPDMANSRGSSGGALGQNRGTQHMGMSKHHQSLGRPLELGLS